MKKKLVVVFLSVILLFASCKDTNNNVINNKPVETTKTNTIEPDATAIPMRRDVFYYCFVSDSEFSQLSETEYSEISNALEADILSVVTEYYDNEYCYIKVVWLNSPRYSKKVNMNFDNVIPDSGTGFVTYDTKCRGISNIFDLNHIYRNSRSYSFEELNIVPEKNNDKGVMFSIDIEKGLFCPYYIGPTQNDEYFEEHTVEWNSVVLNYSGVVLNKNQDVMVDISF